MNVIGPVKTETLVRADSYKARNGFRYLDEDTGTYDYFVPMEDNRNHLSIRQIVQGDQSIFISPNYVLIFNVHYNCAGLV